MGQLTVRSLVKTGDGVLVVSLPAGWVRFHELQPGDKVEVRTNGRLVIRPLKQRKEMHHA